MEYNKLGNSGLKISYFSFGSWVTFANQVDIKPALDMMSCAYENGINFFDNAEEYADGESERIMGEALKKLNWSRDSYILSSKVFWGGKKPTQLGLSRKHIFDACHNALRRLKTDYLDLYFCHRPDPDTPLEEIVWAMNDLMRQGKVMYWGTSEWSAKDISKAAGIAKELHLVGPTMEQPEYNMFHREKVENEFAPLYKEIGLGLTTWSPLACGILTGKYEKGIPEGTRASIKGFEQLRLRFTTNEGKENIRKASLLKPIAQDLGCTMAQLALAWCKKNPHVSTVILGASRISQLQENLKALDVLSKITPEIMTKIKSIIEA